MIEQDGHVWDSPDGESKCLNCGRMYRKHLRAKEHLQNYPSLAETVNHSCRKGE